MHVVLRDQQRADDRERGRQPEAAVDGRQRGAAVVLAGPYGEIPITEAKIPIAGTISGNSTAGVGFLWMERKAEYPRMSDEMIVIS